MPGPLPKPPYPNPYPQVGLQTAYAYDFPLPQPGTPYGISSLSDNVVGFASVPAFFGILMSWDYASGANNVKYPAASGDVNGAQAGIVMRTGAIETLRDSLAPNYPAGKAINLKRAGRIWVNPETDVASGGAVYVRITANAPNLQLGAFRKDADGGNAILLPNWKFKVLTSATTPDGGYPAYIEGSMMGGS